MSAERCLWGFQLSTALSCQPLKQCCCYILITGYSQTNCTPDRLVRSILYFWSCAHNERPRIPRIKIHTQMYHAECWYWQFGTNHCTLCGRNILCWISVYIKQSFLECLQIRLVENRPFDILANKWNLYPNVYTYNSDIARACYVMLLFVLASSVRISSEKLYEKQAVQR